MSSVTESQAPHKWAVAPCHLRKCKRGVFTVVFPQHSGCLSSSTCVSACPQLLFQEKNPGVRYQYTIQQESRNQSLVAPPEFFWHYGPWTKCTATCGTGEDLPAGQKAAFSAARLEAATVQLQIQLDWVLHGAVQKTEGGGVEGTQGSQHPPLQMLF